MIVRREFSETKENIFEKQEVEDGIRSLAWDTYLPMLSFLNQTGGVDSTHYFFYRFILEQFPIIQYAMNNQTYDVAFEDEDTIEKLLQMEAQSENRIDENGNIILADNALDLEETLPETPTEPVKPAVYASTESLKNLEKIRTYDLEQYNTLETLVGEFYAVDPLADVDEEFLNLQKLTTADMLLKQGNDAPQILIFHSHSQEAFVDSVEGDRNTTIYGVGEHLAQILREEYGYNVLHDEGVYDLPVRDNAYSVAAPALEQILADNPSIEVIIDLHRDGLADETVKLVTEINGKQTAQFMFFNGICRLKGKGASNRLENTNVQDNLAFSFQAQVKCNEYYPGLARRIYLKPYRFNMQYRPKSMLIELGAQTNTVQEVMNSCEPIAHCINMVLSGEE